MGIKAILTVLEHPLSRELTEIAADIGITCYHFEVVDRTPPSMDQLEDMCRIIDSVIIESGTFINACRRNVDKFLIPFLYSRLNRKFD